MGTQDLPRSSTTCGDRDQFWQRPPHLTSHGSRTALPKRLLGDFHLPLRALEPLCSDLSRPPRRPSLQLSQQWCPSA